MFKNYNATPLGKGVKGSLRSIFSAESPNSRSREPVNRSGITYRGRFPSFKMERLIHWESKYERLACYRFEFSPGIVSFEEQPNPIIYPPGFRFSKYTPDFRLVSSDSNEWMVEIKPYNHLFKDDVLDKLQTAASYYQAQGINFIVITEKELLNPILESNLVTLRKALAPLTENERAHITHWMNNVSLPTVGMAAEYFGGLNRVYSFIGNHVITTNLESPLSRSSFIKLAEEGYSENCFFSYRTAPHFEVC
ncbi:MULTISPECIES: TnsA endonuclease N-terminal domain-containing protein [Neptuniibacter]|uniref:TnsA endonuclease N-terminal domain-containing protein n=1 Tax=Neptuniibacter TaxID=459520 RepID=UPI000832A294|nr:MULTISPECIES: TnsA endonuclease N-terminal domain-containing protein [Neptuniibacter]MDO6594115.1 Tn7 transposase TnsA N-terminal domain-containing protein [Neptuniibacter sp. 1_MG-2023]